MNKVVVIYKSKYGSTEKYAKWIAEDVNADIYKLRDIKVNDLKKYDTIVYCGPLYAGGMLGFNFIKRNYNVLSDKKLIVAAVGATLNKESAVEEVKTQNFTEEMMKHGQLFILRGGLNYKKMNIIDRVLMFLLIKSVKLRKIQNINDDTKGMVAAYGKVVDFTNRDAILPITNAIKATNFN